MTMLRGMVVVLTVWELGAGTPGRADAPAPAGRWGGAAGPNMVSDARELPADPGAAPALWELKLGTHQYSIPTVDRGRIYIGSNDAGIDRPGVRPTGGGVVLCVEQATGKVLWRLASPRFFDGVKAPSHFDQFGCGIASGPLVDGERVYVVGNRGEVLCLDREGQANGNDGPFTDELAYMGVTNAAEHPLGPGDGDIVWKYDFRAELGVIPHDTCGSTLLLVDGLLYACTSNGLDDKHETAPAPLAPSLIVLDARTGRLVARDGEEIGRRVLHGQWSSPSAGRVDGRTLIFFGGGDGILYAFEPPAPSAAGAEPQVLKKVWQCDANPPSYRTKDGQPVPYSRWNHNSPEGPSEIVGTPVFWEGSVYVTIGQSPLHGVGGGCVTRIDAATGRVVWTATMVERSLATPAIAGGLVYVPDCTGNLHCLDLATGARCWVHPLGAKDWGSSAFVADGKVYAGTEAAVLWVLKAGRELEVLSRTHLQAIPITPTAVDGVLYLPTQRSLRAISGRPPADAPPAPKVNS